MDQLFAKVHHDAQDRRDISRLSIGLGKHPVSFGVFESGIFPKMSTLAERIQHRLDLTGTNASAASIAAGLGKDFVRDVMRGKKLKISAEAATKLADELKCSVDWLVNERGPIALDHVENDESGTPGVKFGGVVEAGAFRSNSTLNQADGYRRIPIAADPRYPVASQFAFSVVGDSMVLAKIFEGMYVLAVDIHEWERLNGEVRDGLRVVVARTRSGEDERELTVKRLRIFRDRFELQPESDDLKHTAIVFPWPPKENDVAEAQIIAIVLSATQLME